MGNNGSRRNGRVPPHQGPVRHIQHPPGYPGALLAPALAPQYAPNTYRVMYPNYPPGPPVYPPQGYPQSNGQYLMSMPQGLQGYRPPPTMAPPPAPQTVPVPEPQKANTIRNDINLKKATLRLEKDEENPGCHLVAFSFDASVAGSICIFYTVKEEQAANCFLIPQFPEIYKPVRVHFEKGLAQRFRQAPGTGVDLALFEEQELGRDGKNHVFPLVIRAETVPKGPPPDDQPSADKPLGAPLPSWVHAQTTYAQIERKDDSDYVVKVLKQMIWVEGMRYELQEIYGIENSGGGSTFDGGDTGKECVICMSEPRDTTVLPCRHMCMCSECAKVLRFQTNRCPICRCVVERLLEIKVPKTDFDPVIENVETTHMPPKESRLAIETVEETVESSQGSPDGRLTENSSVNGLDEKGNGEHEPQVRKQS